MQCNLLSQSSNLVTFKTSLHVTVEERCAIVYQYHTSHFVQWLKVLVYCVFAGETWTA